MLLSLRYSFTFFFFTLLLLTSSSSSHTVSKTTLHQTLAPPRPATTKIAVTEYRNIQSRLSNITGLSQFKRYLSRFGYLNSTLTTFSDEFDATFESALIRYQRNLGLQVTGKLDSNTVSQMITPRCGVPDTTTHHNHHHHIHNTPSSPFYNKHKRTGWGNNMARSTEHYVYFPGKPRWSREMPMTLTYALSHDYMIHTLRLQQIREAFQRAFSRWASVIPVSFIEAEDYDFADIKIGFYSGDHGDGEPFDGVLGVLAHSFSPEIGRLHLDAAETWAVDFGETKSEVAVDLESVATHEIGHLLGLSHSSVKEAVMYPSLRPRDKRADLNIDDIKGVQSLYGSNPHYRSEWSLESDISANQGAPRFRVDPNFRLPSTAGILIIIITLILHHGLCTCL